MIPHNFIFSLFITLILTSCQVKNAATSGGLVSGHSPTTNKFTVQTPTAKTYIAGESLLLTVSFPFDIIMNLTGGSPRLKLTVGATTRYATFLVSPEPKTMRFSYTFIASENDNNGISVDALELNGSTLQFDNSGVITDCDLMLTSKIYPNVKVDTASPTITAFNLTNLPGIYNKNKKINFSMAFSEIVYLTGTPKFTMTLSTGGAVDVNYISGSGSTLLTFSYTVTANVADSNGFDSITSPVDLGTGTLKDLVGNASSLDFSALIASVITYSANVHINGELPYITDSIFPSNKIYIASENLDFTLVFDRPVNVTGLPFLNVLIGSNTRQAQFVSGSGSSLLVFRYAAVPGDVDPDGINVTANIQQNGGDIVDTAAPTISFFADILNNSFVLPNTSGIILSAIQPQATAVARNIDNTIPTWGGPAVDNVWIPGQELNITVSFNTPIYVTQTGGTPSIPLTVGVTTRQATYLSGGNGQTSLVFRYVIQEGDLDADGTVAIGNINLNGGVIIDAENTNSLLTLPIAGLANTKIDGVRPTILSVTPPANGTYSQQATLNASAMIYTVTWSEAINYSTITNGSALISMIVGATGVNLEWTSGNNQTSSTHAPLTLASRNDSDGVTLISPFAGSAVIKDQAGNIANVLTYSPPVTTGLLVDTTAPTVSSVTAITSNGTYKAGQTLDFSVTFSESVTTLKNATYPRIAVIIGATTKYLVATTSTTSLTHTFRYTILSGDLDTDGIVLGNSVQSNSPTAYARDAGRNLVTGTFVPPSTTGIKVDAVIPTVLSSTPSVNKAYVSGETLQVSVKFSEIVNVNTTGGTPSVAVDFFLGTDNFNYSSGTGSDTLIFSRTLDTTHFDMDGLPSSVNSITLNGGTIQDVGANNAPTAFPSVNLSAVYVTYPEVRLWVKSNFINTAPPTAPTTTNAGIISTSVCGTSTCRDFNGDDSLYLTGTLTGVNTVFMALNTPSTYTGNIDLFGPDITLRDRTTNFDLITVSATLILNGVSYLANSTNQNVNMPTSSTNVIQLDYQVSQNYNAEFLIDTTYNGAIGEVIAVEGILTTTQKNNIRNYLDAKY